MTATTVRPSYGSINSHFIPTDVPLVFAFDPGRSTGWAIWSQDTFESPWLSWGQGPAEDVLLAFRQLLLAMPPAVIRISETVIEKFIVPSRPTGRNDDIAAAFEVIGALKLLATLYGLPPAKMQLPVERTIVSNKVMYEWGWLSADRPRLVGRDATSATQHLGSYLLQNRRTTKLRNVV